MTDRNTAHTAEIRSRFQKISQSKLITNNNEYDRKQTRSLSLCYKQDVRTPTHPARIHYNADSKGESPGEAEALQDIIWDPSSPPAVRSGKRAEEGNRVVEISEIVNRIAPNDENPVNKDSVLHWIGDAAISCTPEIQQPRVRRCSARRQSNNVEDLLKLAKQFDLNMTRQHKERNLENCMDLKNTSVGIHSELESNGALIKEAKGLSHEEELHALFDGPTQHLSGRLSPPSATSSQESRLNKTTTHGMRPALSDSRNPPGDPQASKPDFDDDWENDDLLHDWFVLEVPENSQFFSSCTAKTTPRIDSVDSESKPTMATSSPGSSSRASCSHYTRVSSKTRSNVFGSDIPVQPGAIYQLLTKTNVNTEYEKAHAMSRKQKTVLSSVCPGTKGLATADGASRKDLDSVWGDGDDDDDDDLLYQACDDLERISDSQEQQRDNKSTNVSHCSPEVPLSIIKNSKTAQSQHPTSHQQPLCVLSRSHSIPGASGSHGNKQNTSESARNLQMDQCLPQNRENSNHSTFKRHQSDPEALRNKVFITAQPAVRCSAADIERKKQEAIARRRLRLQTAQMLGSSK